MGRIRFGRPTPAMVVAITALFVALGGTGYAALELPRDSVGKKQLKRNAVTTAKIDNGTIRLKDFYRPDLRRLRRGGGGEEGLDGLDGFDGLDGLDGVDGLDGASGSALLTGGAGNLPDSGQTEYAMVNGGNAMPIDQTGSLSPNRELVLRDLSAALDAPTGGSVALTIFARPIPPATGDRDVIGCTITGSGRTCTEAGPATLPANHLIYMRISVSGNADPARAYWGVSAEPADSESVEP